MKIANSGPALYDRSIYAADTKLYNRKINGMKNDVPKPYNCPL